MAKNKPKKNVSAKPKNNEMLDDQLIADDATVVKKPTSQKSVSLKEYNKTAPFAFDARNYKLLLIGLGINILGFILMIGGATDDPNEFDGDALFSSVRITIAPFLIVLGYVVILYAIMKKNTSKPESNI